MKKTFLILTSIFLFSVNGYSKSNNLKKIYQDKCVSQQWQTQEVLGSYICDVDHDYTVCVNLSTGAITTTYCTFGRCSIQI